MIKQVIPQDTTLLLGMKTIMADQSQSNDVYYIKDVEYIRHNNVALYLQILRPRFIEPEKMKTEKRPLIVHIQGSGWGKQDCYCCLPLLYPIARKGYIVVNVEHRSSEVAPFPGAIQDVKAAIRFLRAHACEYGIDTERIAVWGDSSGGHIALMVGVTGDMDDFKTDDFKTDDFKEESDAVSAVVDFFGPTDVTKINDAPRDPIYTADPNRIPENIFFRGIIAENPEIAQPGNPLNYVTEEKSLPPILIAHGDWDSMVPFNQSVLMYQKLVECKKVVEFYKVIGAGHGSAFWTEELMDLVYKFIRAYI